MQSIRDRRQKIVSLQAVKKNEPTTAEFTKSDLTTGVELEGARLRVMDKDGNVIDEWTSEKDKPHVIKRLVVGETYTLHEVICSIRLSESNGCDI